MRFANEAWPLVLPPVFSGIGLCLVSITLDLLMLCAVGVFLIVLGIAILLFFRDPERQAPADRRAVLAPADGVVVEIETLDDGRKFVAVFLSVFDVHVNRSPFTGVVSSIVARPGTYRHANSREGARGNARIDIELQSEQGNIRFSQLSGLIARKISCKAKLGDRLAAGERFGLIYFGSRMEVELPETVDIVVKTGQRTKAGETVIARFRDLMQT